jgi:Zn-dependent alcohol dehydrogenase
MKTIAAILNETSRDLIVDEIELPSSLDFGQVLVKVISSGICGAQINEIDATKGPDKFLPHLLGHEGLCEVVDIGNGVSTVKRGDFAIMHWRPGSGIQSSPPLYKWRNKVLNAGWVTTFNAHAVVSENRLTSIRSTSISHAILPLLGCALTTAFGVLKNEARVHASDSVLIFGAGGVGLSMLKTLSLMRANDVVLVDTDERKVSLARILGAREAFKFENKDQIQEILKSWYGDSPPTVVIETSGRVPCIETAYEISAPQARVILVGVPKKGEEARIYTLPLHFGKVFIGSQGGGSQPEIDIPILLEALETRNLDFSDFPTTVYSLRDINIAISDFRKGQPGRMILDFEMSR